MSVEILGAGGSSTPVESFLYQIDYDTVALTIGVTATGDGHGTLTISIPSASFTFGPVSLDPYQNLGRVVIASGVPATSIPPVPGIHESWPWSISLAWKS